MNKITKSGIAAAVAFGAAAALLVAPAAQADPRDPSSGSYTLNRALNGTGSDTTQDVVNGLAAVVVDANDDLLIGSWDATIPAGQGSFIVTHTGGTSIPRPNGSTEGYNALKAAINNQSLTNPRGTSSANLDDTDLQFARSSSGPRVPSSSGVLSYVPLAVDAVTYAVHEDNTTLPRDLTLADLQAIYHASNGASVTLSNSQTYTVGLPGTGADIVPFRPQAGSGTRSFWDSTIGGTIGSAVSDSYTSGGVTVSVQEHDGKVLEDVPNAIVPFSIAQYLAQTKVAANPSYYSGTYAGVTVTERRHGAELAEINGVAPISSGVLNTAFPVKRPVFNIIEHAAISTNSDLAFAFVDDPATTTVVEGAVYSATRPGTSTLVIEDFGFGSLGTSGVTINGTLYKAGDAENHRSN